MTEFLENLQFRSRIYIEKYSFADSCLLGIKEGPMEAGGVLVVLCLWAWTNERRAVTDRGMRRRLGGSALLDVDQSEAGSD